MTQNNKGKETVAQQKTAPNFRIETTTDRLRIKMQQKIVRAIAKEIQSDQQYPCA